MKTRPCTALLFIASLCLLWAAPEAGPAVAVFSVGGAQGRPPVGVGGPGEAEGAPLRRTRSAACEHGPRAVYPAQVQYFNLLLDA